MLSSRKSPLRISQINIFHLPHTFGLSYVQILITWTTMMYQRSGELLRMPDKIIYMIYTVYDLCFHCTIAILEIFAVFCLFFIFIACSACLSL